MSYTTNKFPREYNPTVFDNYAVSVMHGNNPLSLCLFDTAGQADYDRMRPLSYPETDVFIVSYSIGSPTSLQDIPGFWIPELRHHTPGVPVLVVGLQQDTRKDERIIQCLKEQRSAPVSYTQGLAIAKAVGADAFVECSALELQGLRSAFDTATSLGLGIFRKANRPSRIEPGGCVTM